MLFPTLLKFQFYSNNEYDFCTRNTMCYLRSNNSR